MSKRTGPPLVDPGGPGIPGGAAIRRDPANPVRLGSDPTKPGPFLDARVSDPKAIEYAHGAETRRRPLPMTLPKYVTPVAGGPDLPIPRLDSEPQGGQTMADQARLERGAAPPEMPDLSGVLAEMGQQPALQGGRSIVEGNAHLQSQQQAGSPAPLLGLQRNDLLPEEATKDPAYQTGQGAMYASNQPHLARKYGVMRNGKYIPPQQLQSPRGGGQARPSLSSDTVEGLEAIRTFNEERERHEPGKSTVEEEAAKGPAGGVGATNKPLSEVEKKELLSELDDFDISRLRNALFKDLLNNDEQKNLVEKRLKPLDLGELIVNGRVTQRVPIVPGKFEPTFQSYQGDEDITIKRLIAEEAKGLELNDRYLMDKYTLMGLTVAVRQINNTLLPDYMMQGAFDEKAFWAKYTKISKLNYHMLSSLAVHWFWFDMRVRRLFKAEDLGNG